MQQVSSWLENTLGVDQALQNHLLSTIIVIVVLLGLRRAFLHVLDRSVTAPQARYQWQRGSLYLVVFLGLLILGRLWFEGFQSILTFLGLLAAGLAVALGEIVLDLAAWIFILTRRPFRVGDRIQIGDKAGDVADIRVFQFILLEIGNWVDADQTTGRLIYVPNGRVFREPLANYGSMFHFIWNEVPVLITFESDWRKAQRILEEIVARHSASVIDAAQQRLRAAARHLFILNQEVQPMVYISARDSGVLLTLRYLCEPRTRRSSLHEIWQEILVAFEEHADLDFAYPTQRIYFDQPPGSTAPGPKSGANSKAG